jgi:WD40 repeat protein
MPDGSVLIATATDDGQVTFWDTEGHPSGSLAVSIGGEANGIAIGTTSTGQTVMAAARDGAVSVWDPTTGQMVYQNKIETSRPLSVALSTMPSGDTTLAFGTGDGTIRVYSPFDGRVAPEPLLQSTGSVNSVAFGTTTESGMLAAASDNGTILLFDLATGFPHRNALTGHTGRILSVAFGTASDGGAVLAAAGEDGTIRLWDPKTGTPRGNALTGHTGTVNGIAFGTTRAGMRLLASASDDGTVRTWILDERGVTPDRVTTYGGRVLSIAFGAEPDGSSVLVHSHDDGRVIVDSEATLTGLDEIGSGTPEPAVEPVLRTGAPGTLDNTETQDELGRDILAGHLKGLLDQLTAPASSDGDNKGSAVVHIDGQWGAGKTTLVTLLRRRLTTPDETGRLAEPIIIQYDAWRESAVAPEWWSLATAINRAVRQTRAGATRVAMTLGGIVIRVWRSPPAVIAIGLLAAVLITRASNLWRNAGSISTWITALTAVAALGLAAGRVLFWTSPAFGRLYLRADDNPLREIAVVIARLRRWSPRGGRRHRLADSLLAVWLILVALATVRVLVQQKTARAATGGTLDWLDRHGWPAVMSALVILVAIAGWSWHRTKSPEPPVPEHQQRRSIQAPKWLSRLTARRRPLLVPAFLVVVIWTVSGAFRRPWLVVAFRVVLIVAVGGVAWVLTVSAWPPAVLTVVGWHPELSAAIGLVVGVVPHVWWSIRGSGQHRRPLILVIDDLDRCTADRTVRLLETVHTLLRQRESPQLLARWRAPAPLIVLVLADGRWVRTAFEKSYEAFGKFGSPVHGLGADFVHKLFDHTVLVPSLAASQISDYVRILTDSPPAANTGAEQAKSDALSAVAESAPGELRSSRIANILINAILRPHDAIEVETARVERETTADATAARTAHLLTRYAEVMPANPRLVKRVANVWGMLCAVQSHLHPGRPKETPPDDHIARAAIMFVRFSSLVDELLSCATAPDPGAPVPEPSPYYPPPAPSPWRQPDVRRLLTASDGTRIAPVDIARCYGREFDPPSD